MSLLCSSRRADSCLSTRDKKIYTCIHRFLLRFSLSVLRVLSREYYRKKYITKGERGTKTRTKNGGRFSPTCLTLGKPNMVTRIAQLSGGSLPHRLPDAMCWSSATRSGTTRVGEDDWAVSARASARQTCGESIRGEERLWVRSGFGMDA